MSLLLRESYLEATPLLVDLMEKKMPEIMASYYIALYRRKAYLEEQKYRYFIRSRG